MRGQCSIAIAEIACTALSAFRRSKCESPAATAIGTMAATIEATMMMTKSMLAAMRMAINCQLASVLSRPRRRTSVVLRKRLSIIGDARELDLFRHLIQTTAQARTDPIFQVIGEIRGEDGCPLRVVAAVDQVVEDVLYEHRRLLRSELIEHQQIHIEKRAHDLGLARRVIGIE